MRIHYLRLIGLLQFYQRVNRLQGNYSGSVPLQAVDKNGAVLPTVITPFETTMKVTTKAVRTTSSTTTTNNTSSTENSSTTAAETKSES